MKELWEAPSAGAIRGWHKRIAEHGCVVTGQRHGFQIHHPVGRTRVVRLGALKVHVGQWFCLPLLIELHDVSSNHPHNVTHFKHAFTEQYGKQSELFRAMCEQLERDWPLPFPHEVIEAVLNTGI